MLQQIKDVKLKRRECDGCNLCCTINYVQDIPKPAGMHCKHFKQHKCSLWSKPERPIPCTTFACEWLMGRAPIEMKPSECGFYLITDTNHNQINVYIDTNNPEKYKQGKGAEFLAEIAKWVIVIFHNGDNVGLVYTGDNQQLIRKVKLTIQRMNSAHLYGTKQ